MHLSDADLEKMNVKTVKELLILWKQDNTNEVKK